MGYYTYEYVLKDGHRAEVRAVVHEAECVWCKHGQGHRQNAGMKFGLARWHGPYASVDEARAQAVQIAGAALACKRCQPF